MIRRARSARLILSVLAMLVATTAVAGAELSAAQSVRIVIDGNAPTHPFPHFWEQMFGSGRAILSLRASYRRDLRAVKRVTDFRLVRFHGILDRDVGIYGIGAKGQPIYNFTYVDQIYDGLLAQGVRPFVELSFMPPALAQRQVTNGFWYDPIVAAPKNWPRWRDLIRQFAQHLVDRYGIDEVSHWDFEVWNEPNTSFWAGQPRQASYFHLYEVTARALKRVSPRLRVGGPATAQAAWVADFIRFCATHAVPVDFVSTHVYGDDSPENVFGTSQPISRRDMVIRAVRKVHREVAASSIPQLPIIFSEFNATYTGNEIDVTDSPYMGPWLANTIRACDGLVGLMSYWTFSDVFEEGGVPNSPFHGGFGLIAVGGIPKASYNDFALLHQLGTERLADRSDSVLVTRRRNGSLAIALWNYAPPGPHGDTKTYTLVLHDVSGFRKATIQVVDRNNGSPLAAWRAMGSPSDPSVAQHEALMQAARMPAPRVRSLSGEQPVLTLRLLPHALALVRLER